MYALIFQIDVHPEHRDAYIVEIKAHAARALASEPGTLRFDIINDAANPNRFFLYEGYTDADAFAAHGAGESIKIIRANTPGFVAASQPIGRGDVLG